MKKNIKHFQGPKFLYVPLHMILLILPTASFPATSISSLRFFMHPFIIFVQLPASSSSLLPSDSLTKLPFHHPTYAYSRNITICCIIDVSLYVCMDGWLDECMYVCIFQVSELWRTFLKWREYSDSSSLPFAVLVCAFLLHQHHRRAALRKSLADVKGGTVDCKGQGSPPPNHTPNLLELQIQKPPRANGQPAWVKNINIAGTVCVGESYF